jgi:hypothetical protein
MPCFAALASAFRGSHSNTHLVYTKCTDPLDRAAGHAPTHTRANAVTSIGFCVGTVSGALETTVEHRGLRQHVNAYRCCVESLIGSALVGSGVRQHARRESISKRAPSTTRTYCTRRPLSGAPNPTVSGRRTATRPPKLCRTSKSLEIHVRTLKRARAGAVPFR